MILDEVHRSLVKSGMMTPGLANLEPEVTASVIERQTAALRNPPKIYDEILDNLTGQTPRFAKLMRGANRL